MLECVAVTREIRLNAFDMNCVGHQSPAYGGIRATVPTSTIHCATGQTSLGSLNVANSTACLSPMC